LAPITKIASKQILRLFEEYKKFIAHKNKKLGSAGQLPSVPKALFKER
jgi:hypothetical protein